VLAARSLEEAEAEEAAAETPEEALESLVLAEMEKRGPLPNLSTFAFTATPKPKTLELFGTRRADGRFAPFHLYSMRQAIEEHFILDVLTNYSTYQAYWRLLKKIEDEPNMNGFPEAQTAKTFEQPEYRFLIVPTNSRSASTSRCCTRCMSTRSSAASTRCRPCQG
jgi:type I restriction enzyme R subunit